jgi:hypothetical protein
MRKEKLRCNCLSAGVSRMIYTNSEAMTLGVFADNVKVKDTSQITR